MPAYVSNSLGDGSRFTVRLPPDGKSSGGIVHADEVARPLIVQTDADCTFANFVR